MKDKTPKISRVPKPESVDFQDLFGPSLLEKSGSRPKHTSKLLREKDLIILFFSASFSKGNKKIFSSLVKFYNAAANENGLEIIYVSSDGIVEEFEEHYKTMPWLAIPSAPGAAAIKQYLAHTLSVRRQPSLVLIDAKTCELVSTTVADEIIAVGGDSEKANIAVDKWKCLERKPLSTAGQSDNIIVRSLMYIVKNPLLIFGVLSAIRVLRQKALDYYLNSDDGNPVILMEDDHTEF